MNAPAAIVPAPWSLAVIIPAQNEESSIDACLASVLRASRCALSDGALWIVVVADNCTDATVGRARTALAERGEVLECQVNSAGTARRLGTAAALTHFRAAERKRLWLAHTDADTCVPADWLTRQLQMAELGISAIAGIIQLTEIPGFKKGLAELLIADYELHADGSHPHVHGANLGVRADAYLDAGGWSDLKVAEDHCLWERLRQRGWRLRSTAESIVRTSGRLHGRASGGLADTLRAKVEQLSE